MSLWTSAVDRLAAARTRRAVARRLAELDVAPRQTLRDEIEEWAAEHRDRLAIIAADGGERLSYDDLAGRAARWTRWAILHGIDRGETVALVMANRPERVAAWIGLAASGAVAALLDPALAATDLARTITLAAPRHVVVDTALLPHFEAAAPHLMVMAAVWIDGPHGMAYQRIDEALAALSPERLRPADRRPIAASDDALWFCDGDTPIRLDHRRTIRALHAIAAACGATRDDRLLLTDLDLADPAAVLAVGIATTTGATAVLVGNGALPAAAAAETTVLAWGRGVADDVASVDTQRWRIGVAVGLDAATATRDAARLALPRHLSWRDGVLLGAAGDELWRDDADETIRR